MKEMQAHLRKLRDNAGGCAAIARSAQSGEKRELFASLSEQLTTLADQIEWALHRRAFADPFQRRKTYEPFSIREEE
jgi:hypothetical protein